MSDKLFVALIASGIITEQDCARRVIIDLQVGAVPVIHVEKWGDDRLLELVRALEGVEIRRAVAA